MVDVVMRNEKLPRIREKSPKSMREGAAAYKGTRKGTGPRKDGRPFLSDIPASGSVAFGLTNEISSIVGSF